MCSTSYAATFGHSRIVSALGQPLRIDVPVSQLTPDDLRSLHVSTAPAAAWAQAGLTPPVDLESISLHLADGYAPGSKVIQLRSTQPFDGAVADLLLDVRTVSGQQRHQVSLLTHASQDAIHAAGGVSEGPRVGVTGSAAGQATDQRMLRGMIRVKKGDTMFAIARRHAVPGVTVYQMMMALQRANPQAFIQGNINLVKAGATLAMPDMAGLTAISDKEARRLFAKQAQAFALYRQRLAASTSAVAKEGSASQGVVTAAGQSEPAQAAPAPEDQLRLSRGHASSAASASGISGASGGSGTSAGGSSGAGSAGSAGGSTPSGSTPSGSNPSGSSPSGSNDADVRADDSVAARKEIDESKARVSQLEQNVKHLNEALQAQGGAATDLIVDGAKGLSQSLADVANAVTSPGGTGAAAGSTAGAPESGHAAQTQGQASRSAPGPAGSAAGGDRPAADGTPGAASAQGGAAGSGAAASSGSAANGSAADGSTANGSTANGAAAGGAAAGLAAGAPSSANGGKSDTASAGSSAPGSSATASSPAGSSPAGGQAGGGHSAAGAPAAGAPAAGASANGAPAAGTSGEKAALASSASGSDTASGDAAATGNTAAGNAAAGNAAADNAGNDAAGNAAGSASKAGAGSSATPSGAAPAAGLASAAQGAGSGTSEGASNRADQTKPSSGADRAGDVSEPISTRAEQTVSWIQEHMLGVITGLLALIVLVIAWLLRRANSRRDDSRADNSGLITEAMVREKLDQINLDLSQSSADDAPSRRR